MKINNNKVYFLIIGIVAVLLIGGVGFLFLHKNSSSTGVLSANTTNQNSPGQRFGGGGGRKFGNIPAGAKPIFGQITSVSDTTIAVQGRVDTLNVMLDGNTKYTGGTKNDLKVAVRIFGYGTANSDRSVTAQQLTINTYFPRTEGGTKTNTQNGVKSI